MKLVKITMELAIEDKENQFLYPSETISDMFNDRYDYEKIAAYLNNKLYMDPEFFGEFGPENIESIIVLED